MEVREVKSKVDKLKTAGMEVGDVVTFIANLGLNGSTEEINQYIQETFKKQDKDLSFEFNDVGNAYRLIKLHGEQLRYHWKRGKWIVWNGDYWEWDDGELIMVRATDSAASYYLDAANELDKKRAEELANHARRTRNVSKLKSMCEAAQSFDGITIETSQLDSDPWLFNCMNGTINLRDGSFHTHQKDDYCTIMAPVVYKEGEPPALWEMFINRILNNDAELITYIQKLSGMSITGDRTEEVVPFLHGAGQNGKSTFIYVLNTLLGGYAYTLNAETLMLKHGDKGNGSTNDELANINGKRCVFAREIQKGSRLNESEVKSMTGGEKMNVARKYEHNIEFNPIFKLWLSGNYKPRIHDSTQGTWRRLKLIPFEVTIPESEKNPYLKFDLTTGDMLSGVLNWLIRGCLKWQADGLNEPPQVTDATNDYRKQEDDLLEFIEECCIYDPIGTVEKKEIYVKYGEWCKANENEAVEKNLFNRKLEERGHIKEHRGTGGKREWRGLRLKSIFDSDKSDISDT